MKPPPARKREGGGEIAGYIGHAVVTPPSVPDARPEPFHRRSRWPLLAREGALCRP
jgi:hypothetical protein